MIKKLMMIEESLYEFAKRGRPKKRGRKISRPKGIDTPDAWGTPEDEEVVDIEDLEVDTSDMDTADEIEIEEDVIDDVLRKALNNEIKMLEPSRRILKFRLKGDLGKILYGIPMTKIGDKAFVFKLQHGMLKKISLKDIIVEQETSNRAKTVNEFFINKSVNNELNSLKEDDIDI